MAGNYLPFISSSGSGEFIPVMSFPVMLLPVTSLVPLKYDLRYPSILPINIQVKQSIDQSTNQFKYIDQYERKTTNRSINHYICINQSIDQMINIQVQQPIDRSTDQSAYRYQSINQSNCMHSNQSSDQIIEMHQ